MTERRETILLLAGNREIAANTMRGMGGTQTARGWTLPGRPNTVVQYPIHRGAIRGLDRQTEVWLAFGAKEHPAYYDALRHYKRKGNIAG